MSSAWTFPETNPSQPDWLNSLCPREGRYVLGPLLGQGGMGEVREAWDLLLCRTVALKVLKDLDPTALIRFMHEAQIHARVVHPNICRIYDVETYEGTLRVAMQLVDGPNLEQVCRELPAREVVSLMALVAQAVAVVHRLKLVHRDLKPSNILLQRDGEGRWSPYVCDFGLAVALNEPALTYSGGLLGTPAYMAPEQFRGDREQISPATDVFALGGTLHFALTGQAPPGASGPRPKDPVAAALPRELRAIIGRCLEPDPAQRYPSASALAEDLWRYLEGKPVQAAARHPLARLGRRARLGLGRFRPWLLPLACAALLVAAVQFQQRRALRRERQQAELAQQLAADATALEHEVQQEGMLASHDLRSTSILVRDRLAEFRARSRALDPAWRSRGDYAVGSAAFLAHDYGEAEEALEAAWRGGFRSAQVARMLARAGIARALRTGRPDPGLETLVRQSGNLDREAAEAVETLAEFLGGDFQGAAVRAHASELLAPWAVAAALESTCLAALARPDLGAGDLPRALARFRAAEAAAARALPEHPSDPALRHAYSQAAIGTQWTLLEQGKLAAGALDELRAGCEAALRLDPGDPDLQADFLTLQGLAALDQASRGQDPLPLLNAALAFHHTWAREPMAPALRAGCMLVHWQVAERNLLRGLDPEPSLAEALQDAEHTPWLPRDYFWEVQRLRPQVARALGRDPRPVLEELLGALEGPLRQAPPWFLQETAAEAWLLKARWQADQGLDPTASISAARALAQAARSRIPPSPSGRALEGLADLQELKADPGHAGQLRARAREQLRQSLALGPGGRLQAELRASLALGPGGRLQAELRAALVLGPGGRLQAEPRAAQVHGPGGRLQARLRNSTDLDPD